MRMVSVLKQILCVYLISLILLQSLFFIRCCQMIAYLRGLNLRSSHALSFLMRYTRTN